MDTEVQVYLTHDSNAQEFKLVRATHGHYIKPCNEVFLYLSISDERPAKVCNNALFNVWLKL